MQLSRGFFLTPEKTVKRKLTEMLIAEELEQKFSKQQIFEFYANWVDLGQRGSFAISGFAEASQAYFNKRSQRYYACRKPRCWPESFSDPVICLLIGIRSARWNAAILCSTAWSKPMPSPGNRRSRQKPRP